LKLPFYTKHLKITFIILITNLFLISCQNSNNPSATKKNSQNNNQEIILIDINSYGLSQLEYSKHYKQGYQLAVNEINSSGGINGKRIKVIQKNDSASYIEGYSVANEANKETKNQVTAFFGTFVNKSTEGVAKYANENKIPFLAVGSYSDDIIYKNPSPYVFRIRQGLYPMINYLTTKISESNISKSWQVITYSNEEGKYISTTFKNTLNNKLKNSKQIIAFSPDITVSHIEQNINSNILTLAEKSQAENIFIAISGYDLQRFFLKYGKKDALINKRVFILFAGEPEWLDYIGDNETPENFYTLGYPWYGINTKEHIAFYNMYESLYEEKPRYSSILGYTTIYLLKAAIEKNQNLLTEDIKHNREVITKSLENLTITSPLGDVTMRQDHQTTMPLYEGYLKLYKQTQMQTASQKVVLYNLRLNDAKKVDFTNFLPPLSNSLKLIKQRTKEIEKEQKLKDASLKATSY